MHSSHVALALIALASSALAQDLSSFPLATADKQPVRGDWLLGEVPAKAVVERLDYHTLVMHNGLVSRTWYFGQSVACIAFDNLMTGESLLRAIEPEAAVFVNQVYLPAGGLVGQRDRAYLRSDRLPQLAAHPNSFVLTGVSLADVRRPFEWKRGPHAADAKWPPSGTGLIFQFEFRDESFDGVLGDIERVLRLDVHYELYDGAPVIAKWIEIDVSQSPVDPEDAVLTAALKQHPAPRDGISIDALEVERLALVEGESVVDPLGRWRLPDIHFESDYQFHGMTSDAANRVFSWVADPAYTTQVNYELKTPCTLVARPPEGPGIVLSPGEHFESMRIYEMPLDSSERERAGLAQRRMYRTLAPWVTENPLLFHCTKSDTESVKRAIDQCAAVGFEMVILSFGSGFDVEDLSEKNVDRALELAEYAHSKQIELGSYSLLASRSIDAANDAIDRATGKPGNAIFGNSPCLRSEWGIGYFERLKRFYEASGFDVLEHDGSYPGDFCASTTHPGHRGYEDSQWTQWRAITDFYKWARGRGIYLNVPDYYFLAGSNKTGMGYRETNWSLPREQQLIHARQNIYDGTWTKTPSMGWMFVPLSEYHGGGAAATLEPLAEHLADYEQHLALNLGAGVQACYRGPRLYDTDATKALVKQWVDWFKRHRTILESDIIHLRRADGRDIDGWLHVDANGKERGLAMFFNPLDSEAKREFLVPLYYSGLRDRCVVSERDGEAKPLALDDSRRAVLDVKLPPRGITWFVFEAAR